MTESSKKNIIKLLPLLIMLAIGAYLRLYQLNQPSYWLDEGYTIAIAEAIAEHGYPQLESGLIWYKKNLLHNYLTALPVAIFGANPWSLRIVSVIFGLLTIWLIYLTAKRIFQDRSIAVLSAGLLTLAQWAIIWSRQGRSYAMFQFIYLLAIYLLAGLLRRFRLRNFIWFTVVAILGVLTHDSAIIILPFGYLLLAWQYRAQIKLFFQSKKWQSYWWLGLFLVPLAWLTIIKIADFVRLFRGKIFFVADTYLAWLWQNFSFLLITSLIGLIYLILKDRGRTTWRYLLFILYYLLALTLTVSISDLIEYRYLFFLFPLIIMLSVYIIVEAANTLQNKKAAVLMAALITVFANWSMLQFWPQASYQIDAAVPTPDFNTAYDKIKTAWQPGDIIISPYTPLDMAYLGQSDYWLMISFSGDPAELDNFKDFPYDLYYKSPALKGKKALLTLMREQSGFLILDRLALRRLGFVYLNLAAEEGELIFHKKQEPNSSIWVYEF